MKYEEEGKFKEQEWLNSDEATEYLRVLVSQFRNITSNGEIPFYKLGKSNRYLKSEMLLKNRRGPYLGN